MEIELFIKGLIIGISVSAPMGPIAVFCLQRTLNKGIWVGFMSGLGAAFADTFYAIIAGFGLHFVSDFIDEQQFYIRGIGGAFLILLGIKVFYTNTIKQARKKQLSKGRLIGDFFSVFLLTLSNPLTVLFFGAVFASTGIVHVKSGDYGTLIAVIGVFIGTILWWFILSFIVNLFRNRIRLRQIWWINKVSGALIVVIGFASVVSLFFLK